MTKDGESQSTSSGLLVKDIGNGQLKEKVGEYARDILKNQIIDANRSTDSETIVIADPSLDFTNPTNLNPIKALNSDLKSGTLVADRMVAHVNTDSGAIADLTPGIRFRTADATYALSELPYFNATASTPVDLGKVDRKQYTADVHYTPISGTSISKTVNNVEVSVIGAVGRLTTHNVVEVESTSDLATTAKNWAGNAISNLINLQNSSGHANSWRAINWEWVDERGNSIPDLRTFFESTNNDHYDPSGDTSGATASVRTTMQRAKKAYILVTYAKRIVRTMM